MIEEGYWENDKLINGTVKGDENGFIDHFIDFKDGIGRGGYT